MIVSRYNVFSEKQRLIFNTNTRAMAVLSDNDYAVLSSENPDFSHIDEETLNSLIDNDFVVSESRDEFNEIRHSYWKNKFSKEKLHLTIMTTLDCNFRCTYCFETHQKIENNNVTIERIKKFVEKELDNGYDSLLVDWYGGEPLLNIGCIKDLSLFFIALCSKKNINYSASITTNGLEFSAEVQKDLRNLGVSHAQITIDGNKKIHDSRRKLSSGEGTFDRIIKNIENAINDLTISVRINVDNFNKDCLCEVIDALEKCDHKAIGIYACIVTPSLKGNYVVKNRSELMESIFKMYYYALKKGFQISNINSLIRNEYRACIVDLDSHFIISPNGEIFKCGESYEKNDPGKIGYLSESGEKHIEQDKDSRWTKDPFEYEDCKECKYLPICMGGCVMKRVTRDGDYCMWEMKDYSDKSMELLYYAICQNEESK